MSEVLFSTCIRFSCQLLLCESIFVLLLPRRKKFLLRLFLSLVLHFALIYGLYSLLRLIPYQLDSVSTILYCATIFASTIIMIAVCFDIPESNSIAAAASGYCIQHTTYSLAMAVVAISGRPLQEWDTRVAYLVIHTLPYIGMCILVFFTIVKPFAKRVEFKEHDKRIAFLSLVVIFSNVILSEVRSIGAGQPINTFTTNIICGLYAILSCVLVIFLQYSVGFGNKSDHEKSTVEKMLSMQRKQYEMTKESIDIINMKCHDLKHQINAMRGRVSAVDGKEWMEELEKSVDIYDKAFDSGNSALDIVLSEKSLLCEKYKIDFSVIADGASLNFISPSDIYSLFGNIIDNAIERLMNEDEGSRYFTLNIQREGAMVFIHAENYCSGNVTFCDGLPVTNKEDRDNHGFGTKSIVYVAQKYGGDAVMKVIDKKFCVDIVFGDK